MTQDINSMLGVQAGSPAARGPSVPIAHRYRDAYWVARATVAFGGVIKALGWAIGLVTAIAGLILGGQMGGPIQAGFIVLAIVLAAIEIIVFYILGVLVTAIGQILRASLDTAVNTSPLLDDRQKSEAMGI